MKKQSGGPGFFERYLTVWVMVCIVIGTVLGKVVPCLPGSAGGP